MKQNDNIMLLIRQTEMVRVNTLKYLDSIPEGFENYKAREKSMTVARLIQHLIDADEWLLKQIRKPQLKFLGPNRENIFINNRDEYNHLVDQLRQSGHQKMKRFNALARESFHEITNHDSGNVFPQWSFFLRENVDHELHHCGQLLIYLDLIKKNILKQNKFHEVD